jgi:hypothetical protein
LKTAELARVPGVRIPSPPLELRRIRKCRCAVIIDVVVEHPHERHVLHFVGDVALAARGAMVTVNSSGQMSPSVNPSFTGGEVLQASDLQTMSNAAG